MNRLVCRYAMVDLNNEITKYLNYKIVYIFHARHWQFSYYWQDFFTLISRNESILFAQ